MGEHNTQYDILWEFQVKNGLESRFEQVYGPEGDWAKFFDRGEGYLDTELYRDMNQPRHYVTMDFWASQAAYETFRLQHRAEYEALDAQCQSLTERESSLGSFVRLGPSKPLERFQANR